MRVTIDRDKCTGHGRCYALVPELFEPDDEGFGFVIEDVDIAGESLEDAARRAAGNCPERAITVVTATIPVAGEDGAPG